MRVPVAVLTDLIITKVEYTSMSDVLKQKSGL